MKSTAVAVCLLLLLGACGGDAPSGPGTASRPLPTLPPVSEEAKTLFAIDRLLGGPLPRTAAFAIPRLHLLNLDHARADLVALGPTALATLSDPELIARVTRPDGDRNPWHNMLQVLAWWDGVPAEVVLAWCRPVLATNDLQLDRRAVRALLAADDGPSVAPLLTDLLARRPRDRELAPTVFRALARLGSPWREGAIEVALHTGSPHLWGRIPDALQLSQSSIDDPSAADALAWWALLTEHAAPVEPRVLAAQLSAPWFQGRLLADDAVWPRDASMLDVAVQEARVIAPAAVIDAAAYVPFPASASEVSSWRQALLTGRASAADARCRLAESGHETYRATVQRDLASSDALTAMVAERCRFGAEDPAEALELAQVVLSSFLEDLENQMGPSPTGVGSAFALVLVASKEEGLDAAVRIIELARPQDAYRGLIETAHDVLARDAPDRLDAALAFLTEPSEDAGDLATALLLIRRGRNPAHAALLDALLARDADVDANVIRPLLIWLHSHPDITDIAARDAFVARYVRWIDEGADAEARGLAPGLLDLGDAGATAYAAGLGGERRALFVQGLLGRQGLVALEIAKALLAPVDETTSPEERRAVLIAAYRVAPTAAAPDIAGLRERIAAAARPEVDDVLAVVRHRADRDR